MNEILKLIAKKKKIYLKNLLRIIGLTPSATRIENRILERNKLFFGLLKKISEETELIGDDFLNYLNNLKISNDDIEKVKKNKEKLIKIKEQINELKNEIKR